MQQSANARTALVTDLVQFRGDPKRLLTALSAYPWDWEGEPLVTVGATHVRTVLGGFIHQEVAAAEVEAWADAIEVRDDLAYETAEVRRAVHVLANPSLEGELDTTLASELRTSLLKRFPCPVCQVELDFEPWSGDSPSDEICPRCGIQFGYSDDANGDAERRRRVYVAWRTAWEEADSPDHWQLDRSTMSQILEKAD